MKTLKEYEVAILREKEIADYFHEHGIHETMKRYALTRSRIYQIRKSAYKKTSAFYDRKFEGMPELIRNALGRSGIKDMESLLEFYHENGKEGLSKIVRIGKTNAEIISEYLESR